MEIPKMVLVPREVSLDHLVGRVLPAFETYGDVFRLVLPVVPFPVYCLRNPNHIRAVTMNPECGTVKPPYTIPKADYFMGNGVYNDLGGPSWRAKRRELAPGFTPKTSRILSTRLPDAYGKLKARWLGSGAGQPIDTYAEIQRMVLDFAGRALFSKRFSEAELDWLVEATFFAEHMFTTLTPRWIPTPENLKFTKMRATVHALMDDAVRERRQSGDDFPDMLQTIFESKDPVSVTEDDIRGEMLSAFFGTPAMALTILWGVYFLATQPGIVARLRAELDTVCGDRDPEADDLAQLPYLENVVKEVLRLIPSFWGSLRYAKKGAEFDGHRFPPRSTFVMVRFAAQRHPDFWTDPERFDPDRHLAPKVAGCPHAYLPFGLGARVCLGKSLAELIGPLAIARFARDFDVRFASQELEFKYGFGIYPAHPMMATVQAR